jgi:hypothetical protein
MYVTVQVPEEDLPAVYEVLLARYERPSDVAATALKEAAADSTTRVRDQLISDLWAEINDDGRAVLVAVAKRPGDRLTWREITEDSGVAKVGAASMSISIRERQRQVPMFLLKKRRDATRRATVYWMDPDIAAVILRLAGERPS